MSDDFDPREYLLTVDTNTDAIADKLVTEFGFHEAPRSRKHKGVRMFQTTHDERSMWRGYLTITRTYVGDEKNQTWAVDWYPKDGNPKHIHTSGPQHKLLDFLSYFQTSLHTNWMTNRQAIKQAAVDKGFDTTYIDNPVGESENFDAREYLMADPEPKTPEQLFDYHGYELEEAGVYNKLWPVKDGFSLNVGGKHQSAYGNVRTWAAIVDNNGAAYFGQYTVPVDQFSEWLSNVDRVMPSVQAAANAAEDVTSAQGYAAMQAAWETVFPYEPDAPVQESEDFDPREYLLNAPADYVVKWTFGPPKPEQRLYRYTRINGVTSEEAALREWQAKMEKDWGWREGDDKKPHLVKVTRAVIQDRPVQEADFDAAEYLSTMPKTEMDVLRSHGYVEDDPPRWHRDWPLNDGYYLSIMAQPELDKVVVYAAINDYAERGALFLGFYEPDYDKLDALMGELEKGVVPLQQTVAAMPPDLFVEPYDFNVEKQLRAVWWQHTPPSKKFTESEDFDARDWLFGQPFDEIMRKHGFDNSNSGGFGKHTWFFRYNDPEHFYNRYTLRISDEPERDYVIVCGWRDHGTDTTIVYKRELDAFLTRLKALLAVGGEYPAYSTVKQAMDKVRKDMPRPVGEADEFDPAQYLSTTPPAEEPFDARQYFLDMCWENFHTQPAYQKRKWQGRSGMLHKKFTRQPNMTVDVRIVPIVRAPSQTKGAIDGAGVVVTPTPTTALPPGEYPARLAAMLWHHDVEAVIEGLDDLLGMDRGIRWADLARQVKALLNKYDVHRRSLGESDEFDPRQYFLSPSLGDATGKELMMYDVDMRKRGPGRYVTTFAGGAMMDLVRGPRKWKVTFWPGQHGMGKEEAEFDESEIVSFTRALGAAMGDMPDLAAWRYVLSMRNPRRPQEPGILDMQESEDFDPREYVLSIPRIACPKCGADFQAPNAINRTITFNDGKVTTLTGHSGPEREWENDSGFDPQFSQRTIGEIVDIHTACAKCHGPTNESVEDFDSRNYFLTLPSAVDTLKAMRYEISRDGAAKVFKGANDRDYMLFVTLRGGQSLDMQQPNSIFDLGIYVGKGRDWELLKHIYAMTRDDMQETLEQAENAIRKGDWTGLGLSINRVTDSLEEQPEFDPRQYLLSRNEEDELRELGFKQVEFDHHRRAWERVQGSVKIRVENFDHEDDSWFVLGWVNEDGEWVRKHIGGYYPTEGTIAKAVEDADVECCGVYEALEEPPDEFDPRQYFIDSSSVSFNLGGKRESWNFGVESRKEIELFDGAAVLKLKYLADEWHPRWEFEVHAKVPWKGQFNKLLVKRTSETERLLPKRIEQVLAAADKWWEQNRWGFAIYPYIYGPAGVKDYVGRHDDWPAYVEQNAGDLPSEFDKQTEETAAAWKELIFRFKAERGLGVQESEEAFDPREYLMADKGQALVDQMKALGYKQVYLNVLTDRHATLTMNDPNPEYEPEEDGGGIDQTKRTYARNRVKTAVRELMGLATNVYDFSGDGGTDYLFKIADPEHMGIQGQFEAQDSFDPREYVMGMMANEGVWRVIWTDKEGTTYHTKQFDSPERAMRYVYTTSLWNKAEDVKLERKTGEDLAAEWKEFPVNRNYELIDPDTGNVLIREALVIESEEQEFSARDYLLQPDDEHGLIFLDYLSAIGFDERGPNTFELNQWGTRFIVQRYKNGKYRYAIYDPDGHKMRGQLVNGPDKLVSLLQQHLGMKLRQESEEAFDPREYMLAKTSDDSVLQWLLHNGFKEAEYPGGVRPKFYAVWEKTIGPYQIAAYRGVHDEKLGSHRWWLEIWEHGKHHGNMGAYWSAENFLPRVQAQVRMKTNWAEHEQSTAANA